LTVVDTDVIANPTGAGSNDSVQVTVSSATTGDTELVTLSEDASAGSFSGTLATSTSAGTPDDGTLQAATGADTVTMTYVDMWSADGNRGGTDEIDTTVSN